MMRKIVAFAFVSLDGLNLLIFPVILGKGKKLFGKAGHPVALKLASSEATKPGVIIAKYEREGQ